MRTEAHATSEGVIEVVVRQHDGAQGILLKVEMNLSEASKLAQQLIDAVQSFPEGLCSPGCRDPLSECLGSGCVDQRRGLV